MEISTFIVVTVAAVSFGSIVVSALLSSRQVKNLKKHNLKIIIKSKSGGEVDISTTNKTSTNELLKTVDRFLQVH